MTPAIRRTLDEAAIGQRRDAMSITNQLQIRGHVPADSLPGRMLQSANTLEESKLGIRYGVKFVSATITASVNIRNDDIDGATIDDLIACIEFHENAIARRLLEGCDQGGTVERCEGTIEAGTSIVTGAATGLNFEFTIEINAVMNW